MDHTAEVSCAVVFVEDLLWATDSEEALAQKERPRSVVDGRLCN